MLLCVAGQQLIKSLSLVFSTNSVLVLFILSPLFVTSRRLCDSCVFVCLWQNNVKSYEYILMALSGNVDNEPMNSSLNLRNVPEFRATLTFDIPKMKG